MAVEAVATVAKVIGREAKDWGKNFVQHIVFEQILGVPSDKDDHEHRKDRQNETAVGMFRILFARSGHKACSPILDRVFRVLKSADYQEFSLQILEEVACAAYSSIKGGAKEENFSGPNKPLIRKSFTVVTSNSQKKEDKKDKDDDKSGGKKTEIKQEFSPNLHCEANYIPVIDLMGKTIESVKTDDPEEWTKAVLNRFAENKWIAQGIAASLARYFDLEMIKEKFGNLIQSSGETALALVETTKPKTNQFRQFGQNFFNKALDAWGDK